MKKRILILLTLVMLFSLTACDGGEKETPAAENLTQSVPKESDATDALEAEWPETAVSAGYWELIRIDSDDTNVAASEEEVENVKDQGVSMYLDLRTDGTGTFCFEEETSLVWQSGRITVENHETFLFEMQEDLLILDLEGAVLVYRKAARPYPETSEMQQAGFTEFMEIWETYPYTTICTGDESLTTTGEARVIAYEIFESGEGYPAREGYEWRVATIEVRFFDENAQKYGPYAFTRYEDYYSVRLHDDSEAELEPDSDYVRYAHSRLYYEQEVETCCMMRDSWSSWRTGSDGGYECFYNVEFAFQVPVGYDGVVVALENGAYEYPQGSYITECDPEYFLLFRLN